MFSCDASFDILHARLCSESRDNFDGEIHRKHTVECLKRLLVMYAEHSNDIPSDRLGEFLSFYLLFNLGNEEALTLAVQMKQQVKLAK